MLLRARRVLPIDAPAIDDGGVLVDAGRIVAVGPFGGFGRAADEDLGDVLLTPGLVNAHTHLELSHNRPPAVRPASFAAWIGEMAAGPAVDTAAATRDGMAECLRHGVTCVGDISKFASITRPILAASGLRGVSYGEALGFGPARPRFDAGLVAAADVPVGGRVVKGVTPHAPYTVSADGYRAALATGLPLATHLAESVEEGQFVRELDGPLADVWRRLGNWEPADHADRFDGSPVAYAKSLGLLDVPAVLAHCNFVDDADLALLAAGCANVVWCPRTHERFGHPPHRWRDMLAAGVNVAIGTDSRATSPDLNLLAEAAAVDAPAAELWPRVTLAGARALGLGDVCGSITPGKAADLAAFELGGGGEEDVLRSARAPVRVWIAGDEATY